MKVHQDKLLAARMLRGEQDAFDEFFERYFERLYRFTLARAGNDADAAEEVVQEAICKGLANLRSYRGEAAMFTWLCQICRNTLSTYCEVRNRDRVRSVPFDESEEVKAAFESLTASISTDPQHETSREELREIVQKILDYLPDRYGQVLEWKYVLGFSVLEIAGKLDMSEKAVESMLSRARSAFRQEFVSIAGPSGLAKAF